MKEDVLEQIVEDYLQLLGYFTAHNIRFQPSDTHRDYTFDADKNSSDIDVVGYHPKPEGIDRVIVVSCKSKQGGFNPTSELTALRKSGLSFRELWIPKWSEAFHSTLVRLTGETTFGYRIAVTHLTGIGSARDWEEDPTIKENLRGGSFGFLTFEEMWGTMLEGTTTVPASSQIGRLTQLYKAAGLPRPKGSLSSDPATSPSPNA
jgi:hypothetical protein